MHDLDPEILKQAQKGEQRAFSQLIELYYEKVYALALGMLRRHEQAQDVAQEVFIKVFKEIQNFRGDAKFSTWLYRVTSNAVIDYIRRKKPVQSLDAPLDPDSDDKPLHLEPAAPGLGARELVAQEELKDNMRKALEELSPDHRMVLVLREWHEMSYEEIAESLQIDKGTVMSRLHYARKYLGAVIEKLQKEEKI